MKTEQPKTIFLDIDGVLFYHRGRPNRQTEYNTARLLRGVEQKLNEWEEKGYRIILVTSRKESEREETIKQLKENFIQYDHLIMGLCRGERVIINDFNPAYRKRAARAFSLERNKGLEDVKL